MAHGFKDKNGKFRPTMTVRPTEKIAIPVTSKTLFVRGQSVAKSEIEDDVSNAVRKILDVPHPVVKDSDLFGIDKQGNQLDVIVRIHGLVSNDEIEKLKNKGITTTTIAGKDNDVELFTEVDVQKLKPTLQSLHPKTEKLALSLEKKGV